MKWQLAGVIIILFSALKVHGQDQWNTEVPKDILILKSTKSYRMALATGRAAAMGLHKKLNLRGLQPDEKMGLTMSKKYCHGSGGSDDQGYPCYEARGDGNAANDNYISIEFSNAYKGFTRRYYIVVAAIADIKSATLKKELANMSKIYPDAYVKRTVVWYGIMN